MDASTTTQQPRPLCLPDEGPCCVPEQLALWEPAGGFTDALSLIHAIGEAMGHWDAEGGLTEGV